MNDDSVSYSFTYALILIEKLKMLSSFLYYEALIIGLIVSFLFLMCDMLLSLLCLSDDRLLVCTIKLSFSTSEVQTFRKILAIFLLKSLNGK